MNVYKYILDVISAIKKYILPHECLLLKLLHLVQCVPLLNIRISLNHLFFTTWSILKINIDLTYIKKGLATFAMNL